MHIEDVIRASPGPLTVPRLESQLRALGLAAGSTLLCHTSLSSLGWVNGGAVAVVAALENTLGPRGTLAMPSQSWSHSNPAIWANPPIPEAWVPEVCATMPGYDPRATPCREMGVVADAFRSMPRVRRSAHPQCSVAARGRHARRVAGRHPYDFGHGDAGPLGRLYDLGAAILLLGVTWDHCTALHLAEHRADWPWKAELRECAPVKGRGWVPIRTWNHSGDDFVALGMDFEAERPDGLRVGKIGNATCRLVDMRALVDYAVGWIGRRRAGPPR